MKKNTKWISFIAFALMLSFCTSCYGPKKAADQVDKALDNYPEVAAEKIRSAFPCITTSFDSSGYLESISKLDSLLNESSIELSEQLDRYQQVRDSLKNAMSSDSTIGCEEEKKLLLDYSSKLQVRNEQLDKENKNYAANTKSLRDQVKNIKPIINYIRDDADLFLARKEADEWKSKYEEDHKWRVKEERKRQGNVVFYIPWWVFVLLPLLAGIIFRKNIFSLFK